MPPCCLPSSVVGGSRSPGEWVLSSRRSGSGPPSPCRYNEPYVRSIEICLRFFEPAGYRVELERRDRAAASSRRCLAPRRTCRRCRGAALDLLFALAPDPLHRIALTGQSIAQWREGLDRRLDAAAELVAGEIMVEALHFLAFGLRRRHERSDLDQLLALRHGERRLGPQAGHPHAVYPFPTLTGMRGRERVGHAAELDEAVGRCRRDNDGEVGADPHADRRSACRFRPAASGGCS